MLDLPLPLVRARYECENDAVFAVGVTCLLRLNLNDITVHAMAPTEKKDPRPPVRTRAWANAR